MADAWITKLQRIQNLDLYTYFTFQEQRLRGSAKVDGWHGTGNFPAANIYNDRQDGASATALGISARLRLPDWGAACRIHDAVRV